MDIFSKTKEYYSRIKNIKNIEIWLTILIMAIVISLAVSEFSKPPADAGLPDDAENDMPSSTANSDDGEALEAELADILSKVDGVGSVSVMITFESEAEKVPATDVQRSTKTTEEKDNQGGDRTIIEETNDSKHVILNQQGASQPMIIKELAPKIRGVIVVAEGAEDVSVQADVSHAVQTVLDVPAHKVTVFAMKKQNKD
ncbi:stage III sporulation protein AG [Mahella sp.]|uniref:stage III sporulation protein AG n=1 Tax=Mahella sp. TaxID=2798721 RepID=UPI0025C71745|nr:stage III sporulation protein AG [Mahella sp.]MBZ4666429.1 stage sporulation protein [Mahella sp.]